MSAAEVINIRTEDEPADISSVVQPIARKADSKHLLSMRQLDRDDINDYIEEARAAESIIRNPGRSGINLLPFIVLKAVMRQPSTRTGGSMTTAMEKLGGSAQLISGMSSSSEAKGESLADSWVAFATQADILGIRTAEDDGPEFAAGVIDEAVSRGQLWRRVPVINLGSGKSEHPTQALGDEYTIYKELKFKSIDEFEGKKIAFVGDHERYRAHHSGMLGAAALGMDIIVVESQAAPLPDDLAEELGESIVYRTGDLDEVLGQIDVLNLGRNPDEYSPKRLRDWSLREWHRSKQLARDFEDWIVDYDRLEQMPEGSIEIHPRPRRNELHPSVDVNPKAVDVKQMQNMIPMRMAIIARHMGRPILQSAARL
jgi:aspartate carbamoyltransferase catalytic subunit